MQLHCKAAHLLSVIALHLLDEEGNAVNGLGRHLACLGFAKRCASELLSCGSSLLKRCLGKRRHREALAKQL